MIRLQGPEISAKKLTVSTFIGFLEILYLLYLATYMIECWKRNKYLYSDLEEMFLINMQHNQDRELLARELGCTLGDDRYI